MSRKLTIDEFITKANIIHNNKYDYTKLIYKNCRSKGIIICPIHGEFEQNLSSHTYGSGCKKCGDNKLSSNLQNFVKKAIEIHGDKYNYSKFEYINSKIKSIIICFQHGEFLQTPNNHLHGYGCPHCGNVQRGLHNLNNIEKLILKYNSVHNNKYNYDKVVYINSKKSIIITCLKHGDFKQIAGTHESGHGCPTCVGLAVPTTEDFIKQASYVHNYKYDYSKVIYNNSKTKIIIICPTHGEFEQSPNDHKNGAGCKKCSTSISKKETAWLDWLNISKDIRNLSIKIKNKRFYPDAFDKNNKIIYEFYGDFWHGNPAVYDSSHINNFSKKTFGQLYDETMSRKKFLEEHGYKVIYIWEKDWKLFEKVSNNERHNSCNDCKY